MLEAKDQAFRRHHGAERRGSTPQGGSRPDRRTDREDHRVQRGDGDLPAGPGLGGDQKALVGLLYGSIIWVSGPSEHRLFRILPSWTMRTAFHPRIPYGPVSALCRAGNTARRKNSKKTISALFSLQVRKNGLPKSSLWGSERLEIAGRSRRSRVLLLDEPAAGMNPSEVRALTGSSGNPAAVPATILLIGTRCGWR